MPSDSSTVAAVLDPGTARRLRAAASKFEQAESERDQLIMEASKAGASLREIAAQVGVSYVTVRNIVRRRLASEIVRKHRA